MPKLEVEHLTKIFPKKRRKDREVTALSDISLTAEESEFVVIVGPSGCGKSTLINIIGGLEEATDGRVLLDGKDVKGPGADRGMVFQGYSLFPWLTVQKNVEFGMKMQRKDAALRIRRAKEIVELVGLGGFEEALPGQLSGGMKDEINIIEMGNDEAGQAFIAGRVDAAVTWEPILSSCTERDGGHVLVTSKEYPKAIIDVLTVNSNFAEEHEDIYEVLEECWYRAVDYLNENFEEGCAIMAEGLDLDTEEVKEECEGITYYGREENALFNDLSTEENVVDIANMAAGFWVEKGLMKSGDLTGFFPTLGLSQE